jgi:putative ABC transport system permease protein
MLMAVKEMASRILATFRAHKLHAEFREEMNAHLALLEEDELRRGSDGDEARRAARLKFGNTTQLLEAHHETRGLPLLDSLLLDLRYAWRSLSKTPGFVLAAVLTLGLGIGANTAIFSIVDEVLLRPLDFAQPQQLADVFTFNKSKQTFLSTSYPDYQDFRDQATTFRDLSAFVRMDLNVEWRGSHQRLPVEAVTGNFFSMLELPPIAGRTFRDTDDSTSSSPVALISEELAGSQPIGRILTVEDQPFEIVGVVPRRYHGSNLNWGDPPRVWIPLQPTVNVLPRFRAINIFHQRAAQWLLVTGRLKPGVRAFQAQAQLQTIAANIARNTPATNRDLSAMVYEASHAKFWPSYRTSVTQSLAVFAAGAVLVLLLTCANISSLLLSRSTARRGEFALRLAIGASRTRLVRQLLTESLLLILPSCALALGIAAGFGKILAKFPNAFGLPLALDAGIEIRVLCFCLLLSVLTTLVFGLVPALQTTRAAVLPALRGSGNAFAGGGQDWLRNCLLVLQIAFSMVLLVGGGLFGRSVMHAWSIDVGFNPNGVLTAAFSDPGPGSEERLSRAQVELIGKLSSVPGVQSVTLASSLPDSPHFKAEVQGGGATVPAEQLTVSANFFRTMGIPLMSGRDFQNDENAAIINKTLASQLWPGLNPVGRIVTVRKIQRHVVGVVQDSRYSSVWATAQPCIYTPYSKTPGSFLIVRTSGRPEDFIVLVTKEWTRLAPRSPVYDFRTADDLLSRALAPQRVAAGVFGSFGLLAVLLSALGLYSVMSYNVARRTREIGIRLAIGARPGTVVMQVIAKAMEIAGIGVLVGGLVSAALARFLSSQVKGVSVHDAATFASVASLLAAVALFAAAIPARRAAAIEPQVALRSE